MVSRLHPFNDLSLHTHHLCGGVLRSCVAFPVSNELELTGCDTLREFLARVTVTELAHSSVKHGRQNRPFILNGRTLKNMIPRVRRGLLRCLLGVLMLIGVFHCLRYDAFGLVPELRRQLAVPAQNLLLRLNLLLIPCSMCGDLCGACADSTNLL